MIQRRIVARAAVLMCAIGLIGTYVIYRGCAQGSDSEDRLVGTKSAPMFEPKATPPPAVQEQKPEETFLGGSKSMRMVEPHDLLPNPSLQLQPPAQPPPQKPDK